VQVSFHSLNTKLIPKQSLADAIELAKLESLSFNIYVWLS